MLLNEIKLEGVYEMNAKKISLALATLALLSTGAANAQVLDVNAGPIGVSAGVDANGVAVGTSVLGTTAEVGTGGLYHRIMTPPEGWFNLSVLGAGVKLGAPDADLVQVTSSPLLGADGTVLRTTEYARVLPSRLGNATPLSGEKVGNKMFHLDVMGFRLFGAGIVNPDMDMRNAGSAN